MVVGGGWVAGSGGGLVVVVRDGLGWDCDGLGLVCRRRAEPNGDGLVMV